MAGPLLPGSMGGRRRLSYYRPPVSDINVTPFVDVMLVLLVIFMVTAPMMTQSVQVDLPDAESAPAPEKDKPIQVTIHANGEVLIQSRNVPRERVVERLKAIQGVRPDAPIVLYADTSVPYGKVMEVMGALQVAGLTDIGLMTEPVQQ